MIKTGIYVVSTDSPLNLFSEDMLKILNKVKYG